MAEMYEVIGLAIGITVALGCVMFTIYAFSTNPIYKMRLLRYFDSRKSWGLWVTVLPGRQILFKVVPFKNNEGAFTEKEKTFPVAEDDRIYSFGRAPVQFNNDKDSKALSLEAPSPTEGTRDPGKLHAFTTLYTAQADARARRKNMLNVKQLMMILYAIVILCLVAVYYGYSNHDLTSQIAGVKAAIDNPGNIIGGLAGGNK